jgi:hypothetical protein
MVCAYCDRPVAVRDVYTRRFVLSGGRIVHVHQLCYRLALAELEHELDIDAPL